MILKIARIFRVSIFELYCSFMKLTRKFVRYSCLEIFRSLTILRLLPLMTAQIFSRRDLQIHHGWRDCTGLIAQLNSTIRSAHSAVVDLKEWQSRRTAANFFRCWNSRLPGAKQERC